MPFVLDLKLHLIYKMGIKKYFFFLIKNKIQKLNKLKYSTNEKNIKKKNKKNKNKGEKKKFKIYK